MFFLAISITRTSALSNSYTNIENFGGNRLGLVSNVWDNKSYSFGNVKSYNYAISAWYYKNRYLSNTDRISCAYSIATKSEANNWGLSAQVGVVGLSYQRSEAYNGNNAYQAKWENKSTSFCGLNGNYVIFGGEKLGSSNYSTAIGNGKVMIATSWISNYNV